MSGRLAQAVQLIGDEIVALRRERAGDDSGLQLGDLIRRERQAYGWSLADLARRTGGTKAHLWEIEKGRPNNPSTSLIFRLAEALSLPPIQILNAAFRAQGLQP